MTKVSARKTRKARAKRDPAKVAHVVKALHWQIGLSHSTRREAHLRSLLGLPATPERDQ
jgi:hypothetical protein